MKKIKIKKTYGSRRDVIFEADLIPVVIAMKIKKQDKALPCQRKKGVTTF
jgi:hypothetical protein